MGGWGAGGMSIRSGSEKQRNVVIEYAGKADLRVAWLDNVATISFRRMYELSIC
jgi:hypothetical protein